jgi:omega-6 fatty acid desaturase (delta-12 desaturase)
MSLNARDTGAHQGNVKQGVTPFETPHLGRSLWQLANTVLPFFGLWYLTYRCLFVSLVWVFPLSLLAAAFLVRTFIIFHDCCHGSFFRQRGLNQWVGIFTGLLTSFPYFQWRREHAIHHATNGNLSRRGTGDIWTMTVNEYRAASRWRRAMYRLYRNPFIMFGLGPLLLVGFQYRFNRRGARGLERWNTYATNATLVVAALALYVAGGWRALFVEGLVLYWAGIVGIWLFYVQHQFDPSYFEADGEWDYLRAAVEGSSFYHLPKIFQWLTGNIGYHHVHHLSSRIPNYYLQAACESVPALAGARRIGLITALRSLRFRLWDEEGKRFVGFREARERRV